MISNLTKEDFIGKTKVRDNVSFNSIVNNNRIIFNVCNAYGIIVYESFNSIDELKQTILKESLNEREQFLKNLVCFLCDIKEEVKSINESVEEDVEDIEQETTEEQETDAQDASTEEDEDPGELDTPTGQRVISQFLKPNTPKIYAFITSYVPDAVKIGFTTKTAEQRLDEWKEKYPDAQLIHWWPSVLFVNNIKSYFKDFPVHEETMERGFDNLAKEEFSQNIHYSREFFRKWERGDAEDRAELTQDIIDGIIEAVKNKIITGTGNSAYRSYSFADDTENAQPAPKIQTFTNTELQDEAINNAVKIYKSGKDKMLLAAVMRFGKTHVAYSIAKRVGAKLTVVVSAKADTRGEWRNAIYHKDFDNSVFFEFDYNDNHVLRKSAWDSSVQYVQVPMEEFNNCLLKNKMVIVFATLQDLSGKRVIRTPEGNEATTESLESYYPLQALFEAISIKKEKHAILFNNKSDLLVVDETHYGARGEVYGRTLKKTDEDYDDVDADEDDKLSKIVSKTNTVGDKDKEVKALQTKCQLHLSGTPYQILASDEFDESSIVGRYSYTDMVEERDKWVEKNVKNGSSKEEDSPYFGIPDMIRFGLKLTDKCRKVLKGMKKELNAEDKLGYLFSCKDNSLEFVFEDAIIELATAIFGGDQMCGFLNEENIERGEIFKHIIGVMPSVKACHAFKELLVNKNLLDEGRKVIVAVENEYTPKRDKCTDNVQTLNAELNNCEMRGVKTLTLTWGRFLTGASVPLWDSMLYFKDTSSAQEYDQAIFRICTRNVKVDKGTDENGNPTVEKVNLKPHVYLIDFKIDRMFDIIAKSSRAVNDIKHNRGLNELENIAARDLSKIPLYVEWGKGRQMGKVEPEDFMKFYTKYRRECSIEDLVANGIDSFISSLRNTKIQSILTNYREGVIQRDNLASSAVGDGESSLPYNMGEAPNIPTPPSSKVGGKKEKDPYKGKMASFLKNLLYLMICLNGNIRGLDELINELKSNKQSLSTAKVFLGDNALKDLQILNKELDNCALNEIDSEIQNINNLLNDTSIDEKERINTAVKKLGRLDKSEVVTPPEIAKKMIEKLDDADYQNADSILEVNSKTGEFLVELYNKYGKDVAEKVKIVASSEITKQFIKRILALLDLPEYNLLDIAVKDFIETKTLDNMKFDICLMNPPYGNRNMGDEFIHHKFTEKCLNFSDNVICVMPAKLCMYDTSKDKNREHYKEVYDSRLIEVEEVDAKEFGDTSMMNPGIHTFTNTNNGNIQLISLSKEIENITSLFDINQFNDYEKDIAKYLEIDIRKANCYLCQVAKNEEQMNKWCNNLQKKNASVYLTANSANGGMNGTWFSTSVGNIFTDINSLRQNFKDRKGAACIVMLFNTVKEAKNCRDAMKRPLLRFGLYRSQDDQNLRRKVYKYIPDIDWSDDRVKTDEGLLQVCGCPEDKAKEYAEYCKKIINEVDNK